MDPSKVSLPTFVLEPRSMLERITDFMSHPDLVFGYVPPLQTYPHTQTICSADAVADPEERFIRVMMYYLSGWHIKPKGVKKPYVRLLPSAAATNTVHRYNPVLGEFFRCRYDYANGTHGYYIAEQGELPLVLKPHLSQSELKWLQSRITLLSQRTSTTRPLTI